jgi:hypothetical protein
LLRRGLLDNGYSELPITSEHAVTIGSLPPIHKDPFDRILIAQAMVEGITLLAVDPLGPISRPDAESLALILTICFPYPRNALLVP